jgi:hypothetical protein
LEEQMVELKRECSDLKKSLEKEKNNAKWWKGNIKQTEKVYMNMLSEFSKGLNVVCDLATSHLKDFQENLVKLG